MRRAALLALLLPAVVACAGIPESGAVHVGRAPAAGRGLDQTDPRVLPPAPTNGESPTQIVHGFLRAMVNADGGYEIARLYLSARASSGWHPREQIATYDDSAVRLVNRPARRGGRTLLFSAPRVGVIDDRGDFTPQQGALRRGFGLVRQGSQWRIDRLPDTPLLSTGDASRSFQFANVYYLNRTATALVPEQVLLHPEPQGIATPLVRSLLAGPGRWLAPAVRSAIPAGTRLVGNVAIDDSGLAEVNLSGSVRQAPPAQLRLLSAQVVWTLRQVTQVTAVRLLADGTPMVVPGVALDQPITSWPTFDPAAPPVFAAPYFRRPGGRWGGAAGGLAALTAATGLNHVAVSHDGAEYAGLLPGRGRTALVVGHIGTPPTVRLRARRLTGPTFDPAGVVFTVATNGRRSQVVSVAADGVVRRAPATGPLAHAPVQEMTFSRDGARAAAIVGATGHGRLVVGRLASVRGRVQVGGWRRVLAGVTDLRGLSWNGADQIVLSAAAAAGGRELLAADANGYSFATISTVGLNARPTDVAAAPGRPLLAAAGGAVWVDESTGGWRRIGRGSEPGYAD